MNPHSFPVLILLALSLPQAQAATFTFARRGTGSADNLQTVWIGSDAPDEIPTGPGDGTNYRLNDWGIIHKPASGTEHRFLAQFNLAALEQIAAGYSDATVTGVQLVMQRQWGSWCSISLFAAGDFTPATTTWNTASVLQGNYLGDLGGNTNGNWTWDSNNQGTQPWEVAMHDLVPAVQAVLDNPGALANFLLRVNTGNEWSAMSGWGSPSLIVDVTFGTPLDADHDTLLDSWELTYFESINAWDADDDPDLDDSPNSAEQSRSTNPDDEDSDNDGLEDGPETNTAVWVSAADTGTDPLDPDSDNDGLQDGVETNTHTYLSASATGTDPNDPDSDNDGLDDGGEVLSWATDPNADADKDGDKLLDADEVLTHGTNPSAADTDGDGIHDDVEITSGTNPNWAADQLEWRPGGLVGGAGILTLRSDNTGTLGGTATIRGGGLRLENDGALGNITGVTLAGTANQLALGLDAMTLNLPLAVGAVSGRVGQGVLHYGMATGQSAWTGPITLTGVPAGGGHFGSDGGELVLAGPVTSATDPVRVRSGVVRFDNPANSFSQLYLHQGTVRLGTDDALPTAASFIIGDNNFAATLDLNGYNQTLPSLTRVTGTGASTVTGYGTLTLDLATTNTFGGSFTGSVALVKKGSGELILTGSSDPGGDTTVEVGTLRLATDQPQFGTFHGSGRVIAKAGTSILAAGTNSASGYHDGGTEYVVEAGAVMTTGDDVTTHLTRVTLLGGELASGTPNATYGSYDMSNHALARIIADGGAATSLISARDLRLSVAGGYPIEVLAGTAPGGIDLDITGTFNGLHGFIKEGTGTMRLGPATHAYAGNTIVAAGTLRIAGTVPNSPMIAVAAGAILDVSPAYAFAATQTLAGNGTVTGAISGAGTVAPGSSTGQLTVTGDVDLTGTVLAIELDEAQTPANDTLAVSGALDLDGATLDLTVTGSLTLETYLIASYGSLTGTFAAVTGKPSNYVLDYAHHGGTAIALKRQATTPHASWAAANGLDPLTDGAPDADKDLDRVDNLLEYALFSNPDDGGSLPGLKVGGDAANLTLTYRRAKAATDVTLVAEWSADLLTWSTAGLTDLPTGAADDDSVEHRATVAKGTDPRKFLRLRVTMP